MKNKSKISSISINGLKMNKSKTLLLVLSLFLTSSILFLAIGYLDLDYNHTMEGEMYRYGSYEYVVNHVTNEQLEQLENPFFQKNTMHIYGSNEYGNIGFIDSYDLIPMRLEEGRMPKNDHEVVIENSMVKASLNDNIDVTYTNINGEEITKTYQVVGIVNNYSSDFVAYRNGMSSHVRPDGSTVISYESENYDNNSIQYIIQETEEKYDTVVFYRAIKKASYVLGENVYGNTATVSMKNANGVETVYRENTKLRESTLFGLAFIITIISYFGISQLNLAQRSRFVLLRSLGATSFQLFTINVLQISIVLSISLPFSLLAGYFGTLYISHSIQYDFVMYFEHIVEGIIVIVLGVFFGLLLPTITTMTSSLTRRKKGVKKVNINKAKQLGIFRLAARHNYVNLKSNIIFVLVMILGIDLIVYNMNNVFNQENHYSDAVSISIVGELSERNQKILDDFDYPSTISVRSSDTKQVEVEDELYDVYYIIVNSDLTYFETEEQREAFRNGEIIQIGYSEYYKDGSTGEIYYPEEVEGTEWAYMHYHTPEPVIGEIFDGMKIYSTVNIIDLTGYYVYLSEKAANNLGLSIDGRQIDYYFKNDKQYNEINNVIRKIKDDPAIQHIDDTYQFFLVQSSTNSQKAIQNIMITGISALILLIVIFQRYSTEVLSRKRELSLYRAIGMEEEKLFKKVLLEIIELLVLIIGLSMLTMSSIILKQPSILIIFGIVLAVLSVFSLSSYILPIKNDLSQPILKELKMRE